MAMENNINYTFIIPHKNRPDLLQRCINSIPVRNDVQIIVVDDNSRLDKKPTIRRVGCEIILLNAEQSRGAGKARNVGLKHAKGKWLLFADADDYYNEGFLDVLDAYKDSNYDVVFYNFDYRDGNTGNELPPLKFRSFFENYDGSKESRDKIRFCNKVPWTKMVKCEFITKNDISFEEAPNGNDIFFSLLVGIFTNNFVVEKRPLYVYIRNDNSILTSKITAHGAISKLRHRILLNNFYKYIGYSGWKKSIIRMLLYYTREVGVSFVLVLFYNFFNLVSHRNDWNIQPVS